MPRQKTRWEQDNDLAFNWAAFLAVGAVLLGLVGLALLIAFL